MNAREGIKTAVIHQVSTFGQKLKTMNAREGIKTFNQRGEFRPLIVS